MEDDKKFIKIIAAVENLNVKFCCKVQVKDRSFACCTNEEKIVCMFSSVGQELRDLEENVFRYLANFDEATNTYVIDLTQAKIWEGYRRMLFEKILPDFKQVAKQFGINLDLNLEENWDAEELQKELLGTFKKRKLEEVKKEKEDKENVKKIKTEDC